MRKETAKKEKKIEIFEKQVANSELKLPDEVSLNEMKGVFGVFILFGVDQILKESFRRSINIDQDLSEKSLQSIEIILRSFLCCFFC